MCLSFPLFFIVLHQWNNSNKCNQNICYENIKTTVLPSKISHDYLHNKPIEHSESVYHLLSQHYKWAQLLGSVQMTLPKIRALFGLLPWHPCHSICLLQCLMDFLFLSMFFVCIIIAIMFYYLLLMMMMKCHYACGCYSLIQGSSTFLTSGTSI